MLKPIAKVTGWGPEPELVELSAWAAWRWAGPRTALLRAASPDGAVRGLPAEPTPAPPSTVVAPTGTGRAIQDALGAGGGVVRLPPSVSPEVAVAVVVAIAGPSLVVAPSVDAAKRIAGYLRRQGQPVALMPGAWALARRGGVTVVGARATAWAPAPSVSALVVVDAHDEVLQDERAPTWHALDVVDARAAASGLPVIALSPCPDVITLDRRRLFAVPRTEERDGWPAVEVHDRRGDDPRSGLYGDRLVNAVRRAERSVLVLNRKGRARLLACSACGELARCERCQTGVVQDDTALRCPGCGLERPVICTSCASTGMKTLRVGVSKARDELEALLGVPVGEVTGDSDRMPDTAVVIGTEAVLHRAPAADLVAFLDLDQELLAPRYRAKEEAMSMLVRAARLTGGRREGRARIVIQTRMPDHVVVDAAVHGEPARIVDSEIATRRLLGFPPAMAVAALSGAAAEAFVDRVAATIDAGGLDFHGVDVVGPDDGRWLVRAQSHRSLCDVLAGTTRPPGRLRVEVDPRRL